MRLLWLTPTLGAGGAERQWSILLPALAQRGHDIRVVALDRGGPFVMPLRQAGLPVDVVAMRRRSDLRPLLASPSLREFRPEIVVSRGVNGAWVGAALALRERARHVFCDHRQVGLALDRRRELMMRAVARRLDAVITVTPDQNDVWHRRGVAGERLRTIPNGVPAISPPEDRARLRTQLGLPLGAVIAVHVASLRPEKRVPDFVRAVVRAQRAQPLLLGLVVGDGDQRRQVERATGGSPAVRLLGERSDVPRLLQAADVLVLASEAEAVPMAVLEAMAAGLPVLATRAGSVSDIVEPGASGLLVDPGDPEALAQALSRLAGDRALRHRLGRRGAELHAANWDAGSMIDGYEGALRTVHGAAVAITEP